MPENNETILKFHSYMDRKNAPMIVEVIASLLYVFAHGRD